VLSGDTPLAPLQLTADQQRAIGVRIGSAEYRQFSDDLRATGVVAVDERLVSYVQVRFSGYIRRVFADANYQYVRKGEPLFTIYSPELLATQQEYLLARQNEHSLSSSLVEGVASGAATLSAAAEQRLQQWDIPASELKRIERTAAPITDLAINSPVSGYITERNAVPNLFVEPATRLYTIADLSRVWVNAEVFQNDAGRLKAGDTAAITVDAYPGRTFSGHVEDILPQVDAATRTVQVRLATSNPGLKLKPGMFVNVDLNSSVGRRLAIPSSAVFQTGTRQLVFLAQGNGVYVPQEVTLGPVSGDEVAVLSGLQPHQSLVTSANFLLDSESQLQAAAGAPAASGFAQNTKANSQPANADIEFTTTPAPPSKGNNVFRVKLTRAGGAALDGATVTVTFYMPAMPAMGMSAMKTSVKLAAKGNGVYEGQGELGSGGSWQVTITAEQNGRAIAIKQMRVDAAGGM
jgi:Cu(I)/Ag(I) efflux system membrane fusion protein/cobalt-zinc-cadmium efflux system membrane fusion protein